MALTSHALTHRGTVRTLNEDSFLELPDCHVWVVADGMGGHEAGDVASQKVVETIKNMANSMPADNLEYQDLVTALEDANHQLQIFSQEELDGKTAGSTVVVLFIKNGQYHLLWVGDSRIYLLRNSMMVQLTRDHSQVTELVEQGIIRADEAESHPLANVITRAVGVDDTVDVDVISGQVQPGDMFLLCSDGLNKEVPDPSIEQIMHCGSALDAGMALMHSALVSGARDNVTCIVVKSDNIEAPIKYNDCDDTVPIFNV